MVKKRQHRVVITLDKALISTLDRLDGMGEKKATKITNIVRVWLSERGMIGLRKK